MDAYKVVTLSAMYLVFFFILGAVTGVGEFPPPSHYIVIDIAEIELFSLTLSFWDVLALGGIFTLIITALILATGAWGFFTIDVRTTFVVVAGLFFVFLMGWTLTEMLTDVPLMFQAILVWPFLFTLVFGIVSLVAGRGGD